VVIRKRRGFLCVTKFELDAPVDPQNLHPPLPTATWTFANDRAFPIHVTPSALFVDAKINGVEGHFYLDTGTGVIALNDDFADRARASVSGDSAASGFGGVGKTRERHIDSIEIGGNTLSNVRVTSIAHRESEHGNLEPTDGMIGFDLFAGAVIELSLSDATMRILDPQTRPAVPSGAAAIGVDLSHNAPRLPAVVNGKLPIFVTLDSGDPDLVVLSDDVERHGVPLIDTEELTASGIGGSELLRCGPLSSLTVGPFHYVNIRACESHNWPLHEGTVGMDFMRHFDYLFDYPHGLLYMIPRHDL